MKKMSIEQIKASAKNILGLEPYDIFENGVCFNLSNFSSIHSDALERCSFPHYYIQPISTSTGCAYLRLHVFTESL